MKSRIFVFLLLWSTLVASAQTPSPNPRWFSSALTQFLAEPRVVNLGWSPEGSAAFLVPLDTGARDGMAARLVLIDAENRLLSDEELWGDDFAALIESSRAEEFLAACQASGIQPSSSGSELTPFPLDFQGSRITVRADVVPLEAELDDYGSRALDYRIVVEFSEGREKTIAESQVSHAFEVMVDGFFLSPFEPRMVVVYGVTQPGFEGERPEYLHFSGCLLATDSAAK